MIRKISLIFRKVFLRVRPIPILNNYSTKSKANTFRNLERYLLVTCFSPCLDTLPSGWLFLDILFKLHVNGSFIILVTFLKLSLASNSSPRGARCAHRSSLSSRKSSCRGLSWFSRIILKASSRARSRLLKTIYAFLPSNLRIGSNIIL